MQYVLVGVEKKAIKNQGLLTYHSDEQLPIGSVVRVSIGKSVSNGVVFGEVSKPKYKTKPITELIKPAAVPIPLIETAKWISEFYQTDMPSVVSLLIPRGADKGRRELKADSSSTHEQLGSLTTEQQNALKILGQKSTSTALLHGITGSGKTRVYIERAKEVIKAGKGVIILVPEIGLTSQLVAEFKSSFPDVFVLHSNLGESKRHQNWLAISESKTPIVIGARSALFAPVNKLGLIVVDEEHETAYKQDKQPRYSAVRVASFLNAQHKAQLVLGSATPSIEDYHLAKEKGAPIIEMNKTAIEVTDATIIIVDLKNKKNIGKKSKLISAPLIKSMEHNLNNNKQVLLFHNRRGTATMVVCTNCGWLAECPTCLMPLTHHHDSHKLICHICNYTMNAPHSCPECSQPELMYKGFGTKQIVEEARKIFPGKIIARFDSDTKSKDQLEKRYDELRRGEIDIIVGTQMIAKGLDLPQLNLVGVILADMTLYLPDFSANERTFQLLQQVSGRVGRHSSDSEVIIQTYTPDHPAITAAAKKDYSMFYDNEIEQRKLTKYPPYTFLLSLSVERAKQATSIKAAEDLARKITENYSGVEVLGPTPAFRERTPNGYRWQLVIKSKDRSKLTSIVKNDLGDRWQYDLDPMNLL